MDNTQKVLKLISTSPTFISGETIAMKLGLSRTAVWKIVKVLQDEEFPISSKRHTGYFYQDDGKLNEFIIRQHLAEDLQRQLVLEIHEVIDSTNTRAKELSVQQPQHRPTIIIANQQVSGYGRHGRGYSSPDTGIYMSILLNNTAAFLNPGLLTTATALAVTRTLEKNLAVTPEIKWVNDITLDGKKVTGILTEAITDIESQSISQLVVGIGVNYLTNPAIFPPALQQRAGSLREAVLKKKLSRNLFVASILNEFFKLYADYENGTFLPEYRKHSSLIGKEVTVSQGTEYFTGIVENIDNFGRLVFTNGTCFSSGEVTKVRLTDNGN
ncbi:biotin--[acetyl-CoA-carboxylase] ligase [Liquorilactobacillus oeni]|uniref:Bifunctional ligase/repressor BirA n=1 Tax=Liquorilactobacillus oeni DSM 19972 TaxID=1423777 RepID=A0A0R1MDP8_9LACO|nr:biotin--[acetyl-CoA-carboxylase] ligase [Liquorilactobacillus oeni]KRL06208.1 biotin operon repressor biotin--[acetyl-CoA-carboxylase] synthetase [Liquorilactobacillus oeni DSM 19972]